MVELEMLSNIRKKLAKARSLSNSSIAMFGGLPIVILLETSTNFLLLLVIFFGANLKLIKIIMEKHYGYPSSES